MAITGGMCTSYKLDAKSSQQVPVLKREKFKLIIKVDEEKTSLRLYLEFGNMEKKNASKDDKDHMNRLANVFGRFIEYYYKNLTIQE